MDGACVGESSRCGVLLLYTCIVRSCGLLAQQIPTSSSMSFVRWVVSRCVVRSGGPKGCWSPKGLSDSSVEYADLLRLANSSFYQLPRLVAKRDGRKTMKSVMMQRQALFLPFVTRQV